MALTEKELKNIGVAAEEIWKARVVKEKLIASNWPVKWNWLLEEYKTMTFQLEELKKYRAALGKHKPFEMRSCKPFPDTSSRVVGWLAGRPEFQLEVYGPYVKKFPLLPAPLD